MLLNLITNSFRFPWIVSTFFYVCFFGLELSAILGIQYIFETNVNTILRDFIRLFKTGGLRGR